MEAPIAGIAGHRPPVARVTPAQAATLAAVLAHAARCDLPLPTDDFAFPEQGTSFVIPVASVDEVKAWCRAFQDGDQHATVTTDTFPDEIHHWTAGMFLDLPVTIRFDVKRQRNVMTDDTVPVRLVGSAS